MNKILIIGFGSIGRRHHSLAKKYFPNADIKILRSGSNPGLSEDSNMLYKLDDAFRFKPELSILCNPSPFHIPVAEYMMRLNSHLLIEKPISNTDADVKFLLTEAAHKKIIVHVGYNLRFSESLKRFKDEILSGRLGEVLLIRSEVGQYLPDWRPHVNYQTTVTASQALGGGVLLELSHEIDYLLWIFGRPLWVRATSLNIGEFDIDVEDYVNILFGYGDSKVVNLTLDCVRRDPIRTCKVVGTLGTIEWNGIKNSVNYFDAYNKKWILLKQFPINPNSTYEAEWEVLKTAIKEGKTANTGAWEALDVMKIIKAVKNSSSRLGAQVMIDYE